MAPPHHRAHTHVGIGLAVHEGRIRYVEAYADRYAALSESLPLGVSE